MNIQNLKDTIFKNILPILKILDFRQYIFSYLFIVGCFSFILDFTIIAGKEELMLFIKLIIIFFDILFVTAPITLITEMILHAFIRVAMPEAAIIKKIDNIKKMNIFSSIIFYLLFAFSVFTFIYPYWIKD